MRRILVGGIGRSGTTIALHALYRHTHVHAVPMETKFLVEEDGFADLVAALTDGFSTAGASVAVDRFERLMRRHVTGLDDSKFRQLHALPSSVFERYDEALDDFISLIHRRRFFPERATLIAATRRFAAATFDSEAAKHGCPAWAEKTPANLWRIPFLRELWPDSHFVHCLRDPRAIMLSLMERGWIPTEPLAGLTMFEGYLDALLRVRRRHARDPLFVEIRLEDLVADPAAALAGLAAGLGLDPFEPSAADELAAVMAAYYATKMPGPEAGFDARDRAMIDEMLRPAAIELGYQPQWEDAR